MRRGSGCPPTVFTARRFACACRVPCLAASPARPWSVVATRLSSLDCVFPAVPMEERPPRGARRRPGAASELKAAIARREGRRAGCFANTETRINVPIRDSEIVMRAECLGAPGRPWPQSWPPGPLLFRAPSFLSLHFFLADRRIPRPLLQPLALLPGTRLSGWGARRRAGVRGAATCACCWHTAGTPVKARPSRPALSSAPRGTLSPGAFQGACRRP